MTCVFCDLAAGRIPAWVVLAGDDAMAFLPSTPEVLGHTLVAPKAHVAELESASEAQLAGMMTLVRQLCLQYRTSIGAVGFNLLLASGPAAQQSVPHLHFHLIPRFAADGLDLWPMLPGCPVDKDEMLARLQVAGDAVRGVTYRGRVESGTGRASHFLAQFAEPYARKTGFQVFPGSLNVRLTSPFDWTDPRWRRAVIAFNRAEYGGERDIVLLACRLPAAPQIAAFLWSTTNAAADADPGERHLVQIIAPVGLRDACGLRDGDIVEFEVASTPGALTR